MRISETTARFSVLAAAAVCVSLAGLWPAAHAREAGFAPDDPYEWSAALVAYDAEAGTAVLRARVNSHAELGRPAEYSDGERLTLIWSGRSWASGVRSLERDPELTPTTLSLPVEFVSVEDDGRYLNFRIAVPDDVADAIADIEVGSYVTGTSPRMATYGDTAVYSLRHYNDVG